MKTSKTVAKTVAHTPTTTQRRKRLEPIRLFPLSPLPTELDPTTKPAPKTVGGVKLTSSAVFVLDEIRCCYESVIIMDVLALAHGVVSSEELLTAYLKFNGADDPYRIEGWRDYCAAVADKAKRYDTALDYYDQL